MLNNHNFIYITNPLSIYKSNYKSIRQAIINHIPLIKNADYKEKIQPINYIGGGYIQAINNRNVSKIRYDALIEHYVHGNVLNLNLNASFFFVSTFWVGLSSTFGNFSQIGNVGFFSSINIARGLRLAYSYSTTVSSDVLGVFKFGSHEILLTYGFDIRKSSKRIN